MIDILKIGTAAEVWKCRTPSCPRKIHVAAFFCCKTCWKGGEGHSAICDDHSAERGDCSPTELLALRQPGTRSS
jgi:hypothetical protein